MHGYLFRSLTQVAVVQPRLPHLHPVGNSLFPGQGPKSLELSTEEHDYYGILSCGEVPNK